MVCDELNPVVGFIGLGIMGRPMAEKLLEAGYALVVHNRSQEAVRTLVEQGAIGAATSAAVAFTSDVIITMLPDSPDVERVYFGDQGIFNRVRQGQLLIDMSTASPQIARRIAEEARRRLVDSLDAPVSGGEIGAQRGTLSIMVGGESEAFERALPLFQVMGSQSTLVGAAGSGQVAKACNQVVVALTIEAIGEAFALAEKSGVSPAKVRQVLLGGFAQSRILDLHGQRLLDHRFEPGFRLRLHQKDLNIALASAENIGAYTPVTSLVQGMLNVLVEDGAGELDHSYLAEYVTQQSAVKPH